MHEASGSILTLHMVPVHFKELIAGHSFPEAVFHPEVNNQLRGQKGKCFSLSAGRTLRHWRQTEQVGLHYSDAQRQENLICALEAHWVLRTGRRIDS